MISTAQHPPASYQLTIDLTPHFNNCGIACPQHRKSGDLDGLGTILCAESLPESRTEIACNGVGFLFPDKSDACNDNIACEGQEISLPDGHYDALHVLGMCDWRAFEERLILYFAEGTFAPKMLGLSDAPRYRGLLFGEREAIACRLVALDDLIPHVYLLGTLLPADDYQMRQMSLDAGLWHQIVPVESCRPLAGLVLPDNPSMHIFALTLTAAGDWHREV